MKKCYFILVAALVAFSPLAFSADNYEGMGTAPAAVDKEDSDSSFFVSGAEVVADDYCEIYNMPSYENIIDDCRYFYNNFVPSRENLINAGCKVVKCTSFVAANSYWAIPLVLLMMPESAGGAKVGVNCTGCYCTCTGMRPDGITEVVGKATDILMCSQVVKSMPRFTGMGSCH